MLIRKALKTFAGRMALAWAALLIWFLVGAQTTSLAIVAPHGLWLVAVVFAGPFVIAFALWRAADFIKRPE
jgi:hypothetical protein